MSTLRSLALCGLTATGAAGLTLPGAAGAAVHRHPRVHTVTVVEHAVTDTEQRAAPGGPDRPGDPLTFTNPVFNAANARRVGHDEGFCMRLNVHTGSSECLWTTFLPRGQITVQGPYYDRHNSVLSITGGTGAYRNARGQMKLVSRHGGKQYDFIFQLS